MPTPPLTRNAPVLVLVLDAVLVIEMAADVELPLLVTDCNVLMFEIVTKSTAISVPAINPKNPLLGPFVSIQ